MKIFSTFPHYYSSLIIILVLIKNSTEYLNFNVGDDDLCSQIKRRKIQLHKEQNSGLIVKQTRLNDHVIPWKYNELCRFQVIASHSREGIFAVIQHLSFRKNETTDECIDYIQFTRKDGSSSPKFCGRFNAAIKMDHNFLTPPMELVAIGNSFIDDKGYLEVEIFVSKEPLRFEEEMDLSLVFTSFRYCVEILAKNDKFLPCSNTKNQRDYCIYSNFFNDNYINCPFPDCVDEGGCSKPSLDEKTSVGNKVLIGSISSLFIMFILFIIFLWVFRTYRIFCWSANFANPSTTPSEPSRTMEMNEQLASRLQETEGTNNSSAPPIDEDKDLPPSYDSLFPQR